MQILQQTQNTFEAKSLLDIIDLNLVFVSLQLLFVYYGSPSFQSTSEHHNTFICKICSAKYSNNNEQIRKFFKLENEKTKIFVNKSHCEIKQWTFANFPRVQITFYKQNSLTISVFKEEFIRVLKGFLDFFGISANLMKINEILWMESLFVGWNFVIAFTLRYYNFQTNFIYLEVWYCDLIFKCILKKIFMISRKFSLYEQTVKNFGKLWGYKVFLFSF